VRFSAPLQWWSDRPEENLVLKPVLKKIFDKGTPVLVLFSRWFWKQSIKKYDAIIATYHDQGLIPFKTLSLVKE
jgi:4-hydroxythreonine-4-phosphate dehydrogenase